MNTLRPGHAVGLCVLALLTIGIVMVTSAGLTIDPDRAVSVQSILTSRTTIYAAVALGLMAVGAVLPVERVMERWRGPWSPAIWLFLGSVVLLSLVHVEGLGREVNGARRWLRIGPESLGLSFQPSEVAKWSMALVLATYTVRRGPEVMSRFFSGLLPGLILLMVVCGLIVSEDLGTAVLICAVGIVMLFAGGARWWHLAALIPIPAAAFAAAVLTSEYRMERIRAFFDPYADPAGSGYHMIQSMVAVLNGAVTGRGLGHGIQKFGYLPEDTTDFLFAIICEELGVFGAALVLFLYATLILAGLSILRKQKSPLARMFCFGVMLTVGMQALINLLVVTGLAPTKGIALPLLSSGGTGWMLTAFSLGILIGLDRRATVNEVKGAEAPKETAIVDINGRSLAVVSIAAPRLIEPKWWRRRRPHDLPSHRVESAADSIAG